MDNWPEWDNVAAGRYESRSDQRLYRITEPSEPENRQWKVELLGVDPDCSNEKPVSGPQWVATFVDAVQTAEGWESSYKLRPKPST